MLRRAIVVEASVVLGGICIAVLAAMSDSISIGGVDRTGIIGSILLR
jgi:hypothetical protein